ncbi:carboxylesterase/lipase family protein [Actinomycetospora lutea]|uniref:carboxylesterase/lipase family protein n=1 Tax=Actinomycetospora lutea TaxID=663604 RepID=UPI0023653BA4|nr:carboxylesterase/lipase family protein [Actinomycetospora lutea]MDD7939271.1 carboxylesterase/lipase family protein [Actinomycetospora lutea]
MRSRQQITVPGPEVKTTGGVVRGITTHGVHTWRGIPYAAPPVEELRLRAPQPVVPWEGVRDGSRFGPVPVQERIGEFIGAGKDTPMGEDCLTLNVTAPTTAHLDGPAPQGSVSGDAPRPVMVWFYGGAFVVGASSAPTYRGYDFARRGDVVYVSVNYRLGALGYLDFSAYGTPERPIEANLGLRDQIAALEWVRDNIAAFGGDPEQVTIFGESAGAISVTTLMATPAARGLFHRAIAESSAPGMVFGQRRAREWAARFVTALGADDDPLAGLLDATPRQLLGAAQVLRNDLGDQPGTIPTAPVVDGDLLPESPLDAFEAGRAADVPLIIGTNDTEGRLFELPRMRLDMLVSEERAHRMFALTQPELRDQVLAAYEGRPFRKDLGGDYMFWYPSVRIMQSHRGPVWAYRYDLTTPVLNLIGVRATHGMELYAVFGLADSGTAKWLTALGGRRALRALQRRVQDDWTRFARDGAPASHWPTYDATTRLTKILDRTDRIESDPRRERRLAWEGFRGYD